MVKQMILKPAPISSDKFSFSKNCFAAEVSSLGNFNLERVYDDACDVGFSIVSAKTGNLVVFAQNGYIRDEDGEGDLIAWKFVCVTKGYEYLHAIVFSD